MSNTSKKSSAEVCSVSNCPEQSVITDIIAPRIWKVLIAFSVPFIMILAKYFEALEHTGWIGESLASILFSAVISSYFAFILVLRKHKI